MNWLDASILTITVLGAFFGAVSGAFWQCARIVMVGVGALASLRYGSWVTDILENRFNGGAAAVMGYFLAFLFAYLAVYTISSIIDLGIRGADLKWFDRGVGAAMGGLKAMVAVVVALAGLSMYPTPEFTSDVKGSLLAPALLRLAGAVMPVEAKRRATELADQARKKLEPVYGEIQ